jgi:hypothetical protein
MAYPSSIGFRAGRLLVAVDACGTRKSADAVGSRLVFRLRDSL